MTTATFPTTRPITQTAHDIVLLRNPSPTANPTSDRLKTDLTALGDRVRRGLQMTYRVLKLWY